MDNQAFEINFDGIPGPTHNYSGLAYGNTASLKNQKSVSNPRAAAIQGLAKMRYLSDLGIGQAVIPPTDSPHVGVLRQLGFYGSDTEVISRVYLEAPDLLLACCSSASMWTANAATISPSADTSDHLVHITPANLVINFHRSIESPTTSNILKAIFSDPDHFYHHDELPPSPLFADEGAANHSRFCNTYGEAGVELFVYGKDPFNQSCPSTKRFPCRQTSLASHALARRHRLSPSRVVFAQQNPIAVDAGAFHNDVVAVGNQNLLFLHQQAFLHQDKTLEEIKHLFPELITIEVQATDIPLQTAVETYLFNSQIITLPSGKMALIAPVECRDTPLTRQYIDRLISNPKNPIDGVHYIDLNQSMRNGGGPACLRLRVVLTDQELAAANPHVFLDSILYEKLILWVEKHYRDKLHPDDLADPNLLLETREALDSLTSILGLGSIYPFQL